MFAITGATGKVGGAMVQALRADGEAVRVVIRDESKTDIWRQRGCDVAIADLKDSSALSEAFRDAEGVFLLPPPEFDPEPGYPEAKAVIHAAISAIEAVRPAKLVCLSTVGADATKDNLLSQRTLMEEAVQRLHLPVTVLRPAWFLDNVAWDVPSAREGVLRSYLSPADRAIPMVAAADVGQTAARLIRDEWSGGRIIGLTGPETISPSNIADAFSSALDRPVELEIVARSTWEEEFRAQGMRNPVPRMRMLDGFNEGWIAFGDIPVLRGTTTLQDVIDRMIAGHPISG